MTVLTISVSPYLITRNGKINADILMSLKDAGHHVESLVWHHDISYFLPNELGQHRLDGPNGPVCNLHPFLGQKGELPLFVYDKLKQVQPNVVITIGTAEETEFLHAIKALYPRLFKWIAILTMGVSVNEHQRESFQYADKILTTTKCTSESVKLNWRLESEHLPYGFDAGTFKPLNILPDEFSAISVGRNTQMSNVPAFISAVAESGINGTLHTNMYDEGENDLLLLKKRLKAEKLSLPKRFVSVREGLADDEMNQLFNQHHAIVDTSMQSATGIALIEAMSTGCIPVGMNRGAIGEIISKMPEVGRYFIGYEMFIGPRQEEYAVISIKELSNTLMNIRKQYQEDRETFVSNRIKATEVAQLFSKENFVTQVKGCVEDIVLQEHSIAVDLYQD